MTRCSATAWWRRLHILGPIIPPSMIFIVYGVAANLSIGELFFGGIIPGLMIAAGYSMAIYWIGKKKQWPVRPRAGMS